jgi:hypothetical protein
MGVTGTFRSCARLVASVSDFHSPSRCSDEQWRALAIKPKLPAKKLREKFVWLRNVHYAMRFYPAGSHAIKATLYSQDGKVVERLSSMEGAFTGPDV